MGFFQRINQRVSAIKTIQRLIYVHTSGIVMLTTIGGVMIGYGLINLVMPDE